MDDRQIEDFFAAYSSRINAALDDPGQLELKASSAAFAACFVAAGPAGVRCGSNNDELRRALPQGIEYYRSIGTRGMHALAVDHRPLDALHSIARVHWRADYVRRSDNVALSIEFEVHYLLQELQKGEPKIFAWISGDEEQAYRDHGLV
ncbi:nuclear transport factor 2 family protein [bacterium]|nr:nuclear transport factor 2 family protein [bacterium]